MSPIQKRTKILIDREFQIQFSLRLATILLASMVFFFVLSVMAPAAFGFFGGSVDWGVLRAVMQWDVLMYAVLLPLAGTFLALLGQGIRETFRIAGPNGRFQQVLRDVKELTIPAGVRIRKDDYLQETARLMNESFQALQGQISRLQQLGRHAQEVFDADATLQSPEQQQVLGAALRDLNATLAGFHLVSESPGNEPLDTTGSAPTPDALRVPATAPADRASELVSGNLS